jgi:phospholipase C
VPDGIDLGRVSDRIRHVVVLMMENRSFDQMLGFLDHPDPKFERLEPGMFHNLENPLDPSCEPWPVTNDAKRMLPVGPDHSHESAVIQLGLHDRPHNGGFVESYLEKAGADSIAKAHAAGYELAPLVMACLKPEEKAPALATLAKEFAVCTRWFSSVPGETWPNRNFLHAATSDRTVNIELGAYTDRTIFEILGDHFVPPPPNEETTLAKHPWRIYHDGPAEAMAFWKLWAGSQIGRWDPVERFREHVEADNLAQYSFIEPNQHTPVAQRIDGRSFSQHPDNNLVPIDRYPLLTDSDPPQPSGYGADFDRGDRLVAWVYEALRARPKIFEKTVLVVTYDEHGGLFDREFPQPTVPPGDALDRGFLRSVIGYFVRRNDTPFDFKILGGRVPAIVVSPWIRTRVDDTLYDHASVPRTLHDVFAPNAPFLSARDAAAKPFWGLVGQLDEARRADLPSLEHLGGAATPDVEPESSEPEPPLDELDDFSRGLLGLGLFVRDNLDRPVGHPAPRTAQEYLYPVEAESGGTSSVVAAVKETMAEFSARAEAVSPDE